MSLKIFNKQIIIILIIEKNSKKKKKLKKFLTTPLKKWISLTFSKTLKMVLVTLKKTFLNKKMIGWIKIRNMDQKLSKKLWILLSNLKNFQNLKMLAKLLTLKRKIINKLSCHSQKTAKMTISSNNYHIIDFFLRKIEKLLNWIL